VAVAAVLLGRGPLVLAFVEHDIGQAAEFTQVSDVMG
jgi:hypothetical protein